MGIIRPGIVSKVFSDKWRLALKGGGASFFAYAMVIWTFTMAPIALVTALRETSIIFAMLLGVFVLKERLDLMKVLSTALTLLGMALLRLKP
jgi:drug/metabolite transporter (DMT)-like permease